MNPVRAKLVAPKAPLRSFVWSRWPEYVKPPGRHRPWLRVDRLLGQWGVKGDNAARRGQLEQGMEQWKELEGSQETSDWNRLRLGWCWGSRDFQARMVELLGQPQGRQPHGEQLRESEAQKAKRLVGAMLWAAGWTEMDLRHRRKGAEGKLRMAVGLRAETTMSWAWVANRLGMGPWRTAANAVQASLNE